MTTTDRAPKKKTKQRWGPRRKRRRCVCRGLKRGLLRSAGLHRDLKIGLPEGERILFFLNGRKQQCEHKLEGQRYPVCRGDCECSQLARAEGFD